MLASPDLLPEMDLIRRCARTEIDDDMRQAICSQVEGGVEWKRLQAFAGYHRVLPLVSSSLIAACGDGLPGKLAEWFRKQSFATASFNLMLLKELVHLIHLMDVEEIPMMVFKGPLFSEEVYGHIGLRQSSDIDLLVRSADVGRVEAILGQNGYMPAGRPDRRLVRRWYAHNEGQYAYLHRGRLWSLDLHTRVMPRGYAVPGDFDGLRETSREVAVNGTVARTPGEVEMLLTLCLHGTKERWQELKNVCDVAEYLRSHPALDGEAVVRLARSIQCERILYLGLYLARNLLDAPVPEVLAERMDTEPTVKALAGPIIRDLMRGRTEFLKPKERFRYFYAVQDTPVHRARYATYVFFRRLVERLNTN